MLRCSWRKVTTIFRRSVKPVSWKGPRGSRGLSAVCLCV
ncbi:MAG: hypothetical protein ACQRW7_11460 [Caulobacterales bacterium]